ncbi:MAG TPA: solute carrier family 23 protein, partial [Burkholderiaceae bacterium]|nr:solute carrier family 23 protein [Burkholderiaceae bacterium]
MRRRPATLAHAVDERPPPRRLVLLGLQHVAVVVSSLVVPMLVARAAGAPAGVVEAMIAWTLIAGAFGTLLQALRRGPVGSGWLLPTFCSGTYLPASLAAAQAGGLPLVWGMTLAAGAIELALSRVLHRLRAFLPPALSGLTVLLIAIEIG